MITRRQTFPADVVTQQTWERKINAVIPYVHDIYKQWKDEHFNELRSFT